MYYGSVLLAVFANVAYHLCMKYTNGQVNPMVSLFVTYTTAGVLSLLLVPLAGTVNMREFQVALSWPAVVLGLSICFLELGFILMYRAGWHLSTAAVACNVIVGVLLLPLGIFLAHEVMTPSRVAGVALALVSIYLLARG